MPTAPFPAGTPHSQSDNTPSSDDEQDKANKMAMELIWQLLERETELDIDLQPHWPGENALVFQSMLNLSFDPDPGPMLIGIAHFLSKDPRKSTLFQHTDRAARLMSEYVVSKYPKTWITLIHFFLVVNKNCSRPHGGRNANNTRRQTVISNLEGHDLSSEEDKNRTEHIKAEDDKQDDTKLDASTVFDLRKSIQAMSGIFPENIRPSGKEEHPFHSRLIPIFNQIDLIKVPADQRTAVMYALFH